MECPHCRAEIPSTNVGRCTACGNTLDGANSALSPTPGIKIPKVAVLLFLILLLLAIFLEPRLFIAFIGIFLLSLVVLVAIAAYKLTMLAWDLLPKSKRVREGFIVGGETLQVPKLDFDLTHHFKELEKKDILNEGWKNWYLETAEQQIRFKLDETGAIVKSRVGIGLAMKEEAPAPPQGLRSFVFDKPFLVCLKQKKGHLPYFFMWVNNAELLVKD